MYGGPHRCDRGEPGGSARFSTAGSARYVEQIRETVTTLGDLSSDDLSTESQAGLLEAFRAFRRPLKDQPDSI